jgi:myo-inositol 2-dehydrogenase/D-chiro-inositol 1-dehydrogenase
MILVKRKTGLTLGVIGAGRIGKLHIQSLAVHIPEATVAAVADVNLDAAKEMAEKYDIRSAYSDYQKILKDRKIDAVVICSPTDTHAQYIQEAAARGKHIFCEKPVDLSLSNIKAAISAVEKAGVKLMVGFNRRFDPNFLRIHEMVKSGAIGEPHILRITSRDPEPPPPSYVKVSGGIFLDMAIHDFDMARYLVGSEVVEVFAKGNVLVDPAIGQAGDVDTAVTTLTFANGALGTIDNSRRAVYGYDQRAEVFGSKGMVNIGNNTPDTHAFFNNEGKHAAKLLHFFMDRYTESYYREMKIFVEAVLNGTEVPVGGRDGLLSVAIGLAAKKSMEDNRPIKVSEILERG